MIIGNGDIASVIKDDEDHCYFASGVSNSLCIDFDEYDRELDLLKKQKKDLHLVYFSTLSIYYKKSLYTTHKLYMENFISKEFPNYTIMRLGNITWGKNPSTLINYLKANPDAEIQDVYRFILNKEAFLFWLDLLKQKPGIHNVSGETIKVAEISRRIKNGEL